MKNINSAKVKFDKTIHQLLAQGILPIDIFHQGISSLGELGLLTSKHFCNRNQFITFFLQKVLDELDEIDMKMNLLTAETKKSSETEKESDKRIDKTKKSKKGSFH